MRKISYRDFQRGFCRLKDEALTVVAKNDRVLGRWFPSEVDLKEIEEAVSPVPIAPAPLIVNQEFIDNLKKANEMRKNGLETSDIENSHDLVCTIHPRRPALYSGKVWNDGEEVEVFLCNFCFASQSNKKQFKKL